MWFDEEIDKALKALPDESKSIFSLRVCNRLMLAFERFSSDNDTMHQYLFVKENVDILWEKSSSYIDHKKIMKIKKKILEYCPHSDDYNHKYISPVIDLFSIIDLILEDDRRNIDVKEVSISIFDSLDVYIQGIENLNPQDPNLNNIIHHHPLFIREFIQQYSDCLVLKKFSNSSESKSIINAFRSDFRCAFSI